MFSCSSCRGQADKTTDTVKIDFASLASGGNKENIAPLAPSATKHSDAVEKQKREMKVDDERQNREHEDQERQKRQQREEELQKERKLQEQQAQMRHIADEKQRRLADEQRIAEEQKRLQLEAEQAELRRQEEKRQRQEEERLRAEAEAKEQAEKEAKQAKLNGFLMSVGFKAVNEVKKKSGIVSSGFTYPLHAAVKTNNLEAVELLVWAGADKAQKDSSKLTPAALAKKLNNKDSHKAVLTALGE